LKAKQLVSTLVVTPLSLALKAAQATLAACADPTATVTVTDHEGVARVVLVGDAAGPVGIATSRRKAYSSAATGMTTSKLAEFLAERHVNPALVDAELLPLPGGVPIVSHGVTIGAIGVGGGPRDEPCAQAGIDSIKKDLE
jgi:uncharacterized protein GlcG (DUF336 family)